MSIKCKGTLSIEPSWYIGVTKNISVEGITVEINCLPMLKPGSKVSVLCFPDKNSKASYVPWPEPVRMAGWVV
ncbi:MAG: hypothetical protein GXP56_06905 [Deltaproteobacteria bacterium]|nr:hypothetical protein [Deltaproteobacteria bacterium]